MPLSAESQQTKLFYKSFLRLFGRLGIMQIMTQEENREKQGKVSGGFGINRS